LTTRERLYHTLNLVWGIRPLLIEGLVETFEGLVGLAESTLRRRGLAADGDKVLVLGGTFVGGAQESDFIKIHTLA
jgi:pyruvate kinase